MIIFGKYLLLALSFTYGLEPVSVVTTLANAAIPISGKALSTITHEVWVTAYSSTHEETDDTPFITASGKNVREGIIAANFLPFGTKVKIPTVFGDKILVVEDRMHPRKAGFVDVWMPTKTAAMRFGISRATLIVLEKFSPSSVVATGPSSVRM